MSDGPRNRVLGGMNAPDPTLAAIPTAYRLSALLALAGAFGRPEDLVALARALAGPDVAAALAYGHAYVNGDIDDGSPTGGPRYREDGLVESWAVAEQVVLARVALDIAWSGIDGDAWGHVGAAILDADEAAEANLDAFLAVPLTTWEELEVLDPVSLGGDGACWWGDAWKRVREREISLETLWGRANAHR